MSKLLLAGLFTTCFLEGTGSYGKDEVRRHIPDEYESTSGHGLAMNNAGYALSDGFTAVRANPALLASQKTYTISGGYHWPMEGRDYYQAGVVDSKTSTIAAGLSYTGFSDEFKYPTDSATGGLTGASRFDSPLTRRITLAAAGNIANVSVGIGGTYIEAHPAPGSLEKRNGSTRVTGFGLNAGVAALIMPGWTVGAAAANMSNRKIKDYDPKTFKIGTAYQVSPMFTVYLDARQRDRVPEYEDQIDLDHPELSITMKEPERLVIASGTAQVQDFLRLVASYGQATGDDRRLLAGGVALVNKNFSLSYTASRPYMKMAAAHQAVTLSFEMAM